jgi:hypothetical protein
MLGFEPFRRGASVEDPEGSLLIIAARSYAIVAVSAAVCRD